MLRLWARPRPTTALIAQWQSAWPQALQVWSSYTRLRDPRLCGTSIEAAREGLAGSFAMIRLADQSVVVDLETIAALGLNDYAVEILAHEIGHHVLAPATATDQFRLLARIRRALPTLEQHAALVANLYTDLLINDRLQRQSGLRMADIYRVLAERVNQHGKKPASRLWSLYLRIYEHLWREQRGALGGRSDDQQLDGDAWLGARLVRVYAGDWLGAAGRFAALLYPYLANDPEAGAGFGHLHDTREAALDCEPAAVQDIDPDEISGALHPVHDSRITGADAQAAPPPAGAAIDQAAGQAREPFEYGEILKAAGLRLDDHDIAIRYYRERALPHLVPFPRRRIRARSEPLPEGVEPWDLGDPFDAIDWLQSAIVSPRPIAGLTTMRRSYVHEYRQEYGTGTAYSPTDLDIYVDSSGSMPNPQHSISYLALAGAIIALSALRAGASVQVTLWSGKQQTMRTDGFVRDEDSILRVLTGFYGGNTCFPIHALRDTYAAQRARPAHILMISDDGISTMFDKDERHNSGWAVAARALAVGGAGGTMALNIGTDWREVKWDVYDVLRRAEQEQRWEIHAIPAFEDLVAFARAFSQRRYGAGGQRG